jgi:hypothetical protein
MLPYGAALATISTIVIALRLYSRLPDKLGVDDIVIVLAWMLSTVTTALTILSKTPKFYADAITNLLSISMHELWC